MAARRSKRDLSDVRSPKPQDTPLNPLGIGMEEYAPIGFDDAQGEGAHTGDQDDDSEETMVVPEIITKEPEEEEVAVLYDNHDEPEDHDSEPSEDKGGINGMNEELKKQIHDYKEDKKKKEVIALDSKVEAYEGQDSTEANIPLDEKKVYLDKEKANLKKDGAGERPYFGKGKFQTKTTPAEFESVEKPFYQRILEGIPVSVKKSDESIYDATQLLPVAVFRQGFAKVTKFTAQLDRSLLYLPVELVVDLIENGYRLDYIDPEEAPRTLMIEYSSAGDPEPTTIKKTLKFYEEPKAKPKSEVIEEGKTALKKYITDGVTAKATVVDQIIGGSKTKPEKQAELMAVYNILRTFDNDLLRLHTEFGMSFEEIDTFKKGESKIDETVKKIVKEFGFTV